MEYGNFKRRDNREPRDRDRSGDNRDRGSDRGSGDNRDRGFSRDRGGDFRGGGGGGFNRGGGGGGGFNRGGGGDGFNRGGDRGDRGEREPEESVFSKRVRAGKRRTYFFDVRKTKGSDFFITITESTRREDGFGYKRHKIFLYKEDFNRFVASLNEVVNHVKTDLMPEFDYEEFDRRQAEWEAQNRDNEEEDDRSNPEGVFQRVGEEKEPDEELDREQDIEQDADEKPLKDKDDDEVSW